MKNSLAKAKLFVLEEYLVLGTAGRELCIPVCPCVTDGQTKEKETTTPPLQTLMASSA